MLPVVYMAKFDMLNPNLTSKITQNLNQSQKHRGKNDFQTINKNSKQISYKLCWLGTLFRTLSVPNIRSVFPMFLALVEVFGDFRRQIRIQHVELL